MAMYQTCPRVIFGPTAAPHSSVERTSARPTPRCKCPGAEVPFYCPVHGRVENTNWQLLQLISFNTSSEE
jgi:hypothetical protein